MPAGILRLIVSTSPLPRRTVMAAWPPNTAVELNGWGDDLVHEYLRAIEVGGRIGVLYSNKDYGCEWDYDFRNKRWLAVDNTRFAVNIIQYALGA